MNKKLTRQTMKESLSKLDRLSYEQFSFQIAQRLYGLKVWEEAQTVAVTVSNVPEVDTWQIIRQGWLEGKRMVVPKCVPASRKMDFYELTSFTELENIYANLYEPEPVRTNLVPREEMDFVLVPGLAFSRSGHRLGFGGGYYDCFLSGYTGKMAALAFSMQLLEDIPKEPHDLPVNTIITEKEVISCS
ncbi:5-formyltetrahydrofolate cyclo-ligase [Bacillus thermotolerans]|uniref:5-formyltetrahydrofolate cyclo-ligase n=1 Tax=Bacillus thermotolerans TaxID=1221996 RepID=UPI000582FFC6|nr:5-formyltetrahydrofolate cyclo-ligase [Bacillus thermotolerans]KKB37285.1 5-formyltetrahydrofolate cyclo-ligase [Bacillus thermotolerans]